MYNNLMNTVNWIPNVTVRSAKGSYLYTNVNGINKTLLDWFCDVGLVSLGYNEEGLLNIIQLNGLPQHLPNLLYGEFKDRITHELCDLTYMKKAFYCNSGTESVETAIKIIRKYNSIHNPDGKYIYTAKGGFHGRTYGSMSASDGAPYHTKGFEPLVPGFKHFEKIGDINPNDCAGIMIAPIFGNNDVIPYPKSFFENLYKFKIEYNLPLVFDEVQAGACRTGKFNGFDNYGIIPDILCLAKGIACGIPTGVTLARNGFEDILTPGSHFSTFGGSPWSIAGISRMIHFALTPNSLNKIRQYNGIMVEELKGMPGVKEVRSVGFLIAISVENNRAFEVSEKCLGNDLFIPTFRKTGLKITPPLNSTYTEISEGLEKLYKSLNEVYK